MVDKLAIYISDADVRLVPVFKEKKQEVSFRPSQSQAQEMNDGRRPPSCVPEKILAITRCL
jgi:hypothetical protein